MNVFDLYPFNKLQKFPIANIIHIFLGILMIDYDFLFWVIIIYTII